jgi:ADP-ribose pyrophosphatase YjhB (NUDIX family)
MEDKKEYRCPSLAVDLIIRCDKPNGQQGYVLIERKNPPYGYAMPGGFVDYGESTYDAAIREAKEETGLDIHLVRQLFTYSNPQRDPRKHVVSVAYIATAEGEPVAADDAKAIVFAPAFCLIDWVNANRDKLVCDHFYILHDYIRRLDGFVVEPEVERHRWK